MKTRHSMIREAESRGDGDSLGSFGALRLVSSSIRGSPDKRVWRIISVASGERGTLLPPAYAGYQSQQRNYTLNPQTTRVCIDLLEKSP